MKDALPELLTALYAKLRTDSWRWFVGRAPQGQALPYGVIRRGVALDESAQGREGAVHYFTLELFADDAIEVATEMSAVIELLDRTKLSLTGSHTNWCAEMDGVMEWLHDDDADVPYFVGRQRVKYNTEYTG